MAGESALRFGYASALADCARARVGLHRVAMIHHVFRFNASFVVGPRFCNIETSSR